MEKRNFDSYELVLDYVNFSLELAQKNLPLRDFNRKLHERLSQSMGISEEGLVNIIQPLSHLHFFQNKNGDSGNWNDSWIDYSEKIISLKNNPPKEEISRVVELFHDMYGKEIEGRKFLYDISIYRQQS